MKVNFLGDLHGNRSIAFKKNTIQVGDLDLLNYKNYGPYTKNKRFFIDGNHEAFHLINPNAENPYQIKKGLVYIPRGHFSGEVLFIGGAGSVDYNLRAIREIQRYQKKHGIDSVGIEVKNAILSILMRKIMGQYVRWEDRLDPSIKEFYNSLPYPDRHEWFPEEDITKEQLDKILNTNRKVEVIVAHDCPISFMKKIVPSIIQPYDNTNHALQSIFDKFRPKLWIFGHHHTPIDEKFKGCRFVCLDIGCSMEIEVPLANNFFDIDY